METRRIIRSLAFISLFTLMASCSSSVKVSDTKRQEIKKNVEFEKTVEIIAQEPVPEESSGDVTSTATKIEEKKETLTKPVSASTEKKATSSKTIEKKEATKKTTTTPAAGAKAASKVSTTEVSKKKEAGKRKPDLEDSEGFEGRRPIVDPFRVGEVLTHDVNYFKVSAGELKLKVEPFATVNGRKSYAFATEIKTSTVFSTFYSVEDRAVTYLDYEDLTPRTYSLSVKESGQVREARSYFNFSTLKGTMWEKKITKKNGEEQKKLEWDILPYSQNVFSAIFYMRNFAWKDGKEYSFVVSHDEENLVFKGKVIRREKLKTKVGEFNAIVIKPEFTLKGMFKPVGDIFIWLSDDERKYILRIESKIKIGTLISEVIDIKPGRP